MSLRRPVSPALRSAPRLLAATLAVVLLSAAGCTGSTKYLQPTNMAAPGLGRAEHSPVEARKSPADQQSAAEKRTPESPPNQATRVMVYTAAYRIVVGDVAESIRRAERLAGSLGGYVASVDGPTIVLRIPVARYREGLAAVEALGQVTQRAEEALDVTEQYVDLEARLKNALAVRDRLKALLEKAEDVKTALEVEKELKRVGEEIESLEARLEVLRNRVAFCTVTATFERVAQQTQFSGATRLPFEWLRRLDPNRLW